MTPRKQNANLHIITEPLPPGWAQPIKSTSVRGTEKFYYQTAKHAADWFHQVFIHTTAKVDVKTVEGNVFEVHPNDINKPTIRPEDTVLVCNPRESCRDLLKTGANCILWTNFCMPQDQFAAWFRVIGGDDFQNQAVCISHYHRRTMPTDVQPWFRVVHHGIDREVFRPPSISQKTRKNTLVFSSSPDRGWTKALHDMQSRIAGAGWELVNTGYGNYSQAEMVRLLQEAKFWVHPGYGNELFCMAGVEAQACGCTPIVVPNKALAETIQHGIRTTEQSFREVIYAVVDSELCGFDGINANHIPGWSDATRALLFGVSDYGGPGFVFGSTPVV